MTCTLTDAPPHVAQRCGCTEYRPPIYPQWQMSVGTWTIRPMTDQERAELTPEEYAALRYLPAGEDPAEPYPHPDDPPPDSVNTGGERQTGRSPSSVCCTAGKGGP